LIRDVRDASPQATPLVVGAMARDLVLHYGHGVPIARATADVDLAFEVADWRGFDALLGSGKFTQDSAPHRLRHRSRTPIELIPFGAVEAPDRTITWPTTGNVMQMVEYREARAPPASGISRWRTRTPSLISGSSRTVRLTETPHPARGTAQVQSENAPTIASDRKSALNHSTVGLFAVRENMRMIANDRF